MSRFTRPGPGYIAMFRKSRHGGGDPPPFVIRSSTSAIYPLSRGLQPVTKSGCAKLEYAVIFLKHGRSPHYTNRCIHLHFVLCQALLQGVETTFQT